MPDLVCFISFLRSCLFCSSQPAGGHLLIYVVFLYLLDIEVFCLILYLCICFAVAGRFYLICAVVFEHEKDAERHLDSDGGSIVPPFCF